MFRAAFAGKAEETKSAVMDMYALTKELRERIGPDASDALGARTADGKPDRTHLSPKGQQEIEDASGGPFRVAASTAMV